jgi:hypothetical protein
LSGNVTAVTDVVRIECLRSNDRASSPNICNPLHRGGIPCSLRKSLYGSKN